MKNSVGELSLVIVTLLAISLIAISVREMTNRGVDYILYMLNFKSEATAIQETPENFAAVSVDKSSTVGMALTQRVNNLLNDNKLDNIKVSNDINSELQKKFGNAEKFISYKTKDGYISSAKLSSGKTYYIEYEEKVNIFGNPKYEIKTVVNTTEDSILKESISKENTQNETYDELNIVNDSYDYLSYAKVNDTIKKDQQIEKIYENGIIKLKY